MKCQFCEREAVMGCYCLRCDKIVGDVEIKMKQIALAEMRDRKGGDRE